jgi:signal recognition particle receptor subunit beta
MVQFNFSERTIKAKVVYYGPAQSGKTTNLEEIHRLTDPAANNRLISLNTAQDRTLFFDLLPFSLGAVAGYDFKVQLYTVPGQVQYNATRRVVLAGADAVVFVADGRRSLMKENLAAFENMKVNLLANRLVPEKVPLVLQYNKQDLPDLMPEAEIGKLLNPWGRRAFAAVAAQGQGVMETFVAVVQEMLHAIAVKYNLKEKGLDPAIVQEVVHQAFASVLKEAEVAGANAPRSGAAGSAPAGRVVLSQQTDSLHAAPPQMSDDNAGLVSEELLHRAIRSNVDLAEALAGLVREMNLGLGTILSHAELLMVYREDAREKRATAISSIQQEAARLRKIVQNLGLAGAAAPAAAAPARPAPPPISVNASATRVVPAAPPAEAAPAPPVPTAPLAAPVSEGVKAILDGVLAAAGPALQEQGITVEVKVPPATPPPGCPLPALQRVLTGTLQALASVCTPGSALVIRCERKPVLLRSKDGEVRRDFLMIALAHTGTLSPEDQQKIAQGSDQTALGQAARQYRELGGFVRFAPLPGGALEARVFLPAS